MAGDRSGERGLRSERGFIVVAVLWILAALSALVLIYLTYVTNTAVVVAVSSARVQAEALESAGVELAAYRLIGVKADRRPTSGSFDVRVGTGRVSVSYRSEAARIDLNAAPKPLLAGLMVALGASPSNASTYADRILAWRTPPEQGDDDPENSFYRASGSAYAPRHAPFPSVEELWLVQGVPAVMVEGMLPFVTVFSNAASINLRDAAPQVLAALPGMTPERLQELLTQRADPALDPHALLGIVGGEAASLAGSLAYRMSIAVDPGNGRPALAEVVILLNEDGDAPYRIVSWHNASDSGATGRRASVE
jgi:general secretion pathway protein K